MCLTVTCVSSKPRALLPSNSLTRAPRNGSNWHEAWGWTWKFSRPCFQNSHWVANSISAAWSARQSGKLQKCILLDVAALAWHRRCQMFAGPGDSLGHFDDNQPDRLRCSPRPSHCHRVAAANARCEMRPHQQCQARVSSCWRAHGTFQASEPSTPGLHLGRHGHLVWFFFRGCARRPRWC